MMTSARFQDSTADRQAIVNWHGRGKWHVVFQVWSRMNKDHVPDHTATFSSQAKAMRVAREWTDR